MASDRNDRGVEAGARLPGIVSVRVRRARYAEPQRYFVGLQPHDATEGVEVLIETGRPPAARAITPVAFIGDIAPNKVEVTGQGLLRFFFFELGRLRPGAPISFGFLKSPKLRLPTNVRFDPGRLPVA